MPVVTAHALAAHSVFGAAASRRLQKAMEDAVLKANQEGISNSEEDAGVMRRRIRNAHQKELLLITQEEHDRLMAEMRADHEAKLSNLVRSHEERLIHVERAHADEIESIKATIVPDA